ncbi:acyltransferase [Cytobacillus sp. NCCP-133]|uniref:acyltransferase n=1 Tax=Cytobacillus sp. NCCP-133 TaxID=766848 RepID=UPI00222E2166|nr:DapH/DapD/GlmU-related protein [Cytobacillus sp. NCCP-133]GLB61749.1 hypothetical protein NCCP133_38780 [Cytobacillus sp. NCCP-133]
MIIGDKCAIAPQLMFCTTTHDIGKYSRAGKLIRKPIIVEDGCWIGTRATILPGVRIGKECIIAAG